MRPRDHAISEDVFGRVHTPRVSYAAAAVGANRLSHDRLCFTCPAEHAALARRLFTVATPRYTVQDAQTRRHSSLSLTPAYAPAPGYIRERLRQERKTAGKKTTTRMAVVHDDRAKAEKVAGARSAPEFVVRHVEHGSHGLTSFRGHTAPTKSGSMLCSWALLVPPLSLSPRDELTPPRCTSIHRRKQQTALWRRVYTHRRCDGYKLASHCTRIRAFISLFFLLLLLLIAPLQRTLPTCHHGQGTCDTAAALFFPTRRLR